MAGAKGTFVVVSQNADGTEFETELKGTAVTRNDQTQVVSVVDGTDLVGEFARCIRWYRKA